MLRAAAHRAALHAKGRVVDTVAADVVVVEVVIAKHVRCIPLHVQAVAMRHRCLSNHVTAGPSIVTIVISRKVLAAGATTARAGNPHESHSRESGRFF